jgi:hypothetical protein
MRFVLGVIVGIFLTLGVAYLHDASVRTDASAPGAAARPMVNWDVVETEWQRITGRLRREWDRLAAK